MPEKITPVIAHKKVFWSRLKWRWPFLVWIIAAAIGWFLFYHGGRVESTYGIVEYSVDPIFPASDAFLKKLHVTPGQKITAGAIIAELDSSAEDGDIADFQLHLEERANDTRETLLRNATDAVATLERELRTLRLEQARDTGALQSLKNQIADLQKAVTAGVITRDVISRLEKDVGGLENAITLYPALLGEAQVSLENARKKVSEISQNTPQISQSDTAKKYAASLDAAKAKTILRAPRDGTVINVYAQIGQLVRPQMLEPIAEIIADKRPVIIAFLQEESEIKTTVGAKTTLFTNNKNNTTMTGTVAYVAPVIEVLRDRINPVPNHFVHGRKVIIEIDGDTSELLPGQAVQILYGTANWWDILFH